MTPAVSRRRRRWPELLSVGGSLFILVYVCAIAAGGHLLVVRTPVGHADAIVVLGGDFWHRGNRAAELFRQGLAPRVLASGSGDCNRVRGRMISEGVPREAITVECASKSTIENAAFSGPILDAMGVRSALLVTSWYHTRRALVTFRMEQPEIHWMMAPVARRESLWQLLWDHNGEAAAAEYIKLAYYAARYGVSLETKAAATHKAKP